MATKEVKKLYESSLDDELKRDVKEASKELGAEVFSGDGDIETALNRSLLVAKRMQMFGDRGDYPDLLLVGEAGTGKTSRIRDWAKKNNVNLFEVRAAGMDDTDLGGASVPMGEVVKRLASTEFDYLEEPNSVLFLDEYNRAPKSVRTNLLELINSHVVPDPRKKEYHGQRFLPNFLFTVAAINPSSAEYDTDELDIAEVSRFRILVVAMQKQLYLNYLNNEIDRKLKTENLSDKVKLELERKRDLVNTIIPNKLFMFDDARTTAEMKNSNIGNLVAPTNSRTFKKLLKYCDGTKEDFLKMWNGFCNPNQKDIIETILKDYKDKDDKATAALANYDTKNPVFKEKESPEDRYARLKKQWGK